jgi:hypothetical protein
VWGGGGGGGGVCGLVDSAIVVIFQGTGQSFSTKTIANNVSYALKKYQNRKITFVPLFVDNLFALSFQDHNSSYVASVVFDSVRKFSVR